MCVVVDSINDEDKTEDDGQGYYTGCRMEESEGGGGGMRRGRHSPRYVQGAPSANKVSRKLICYLAARKFYFWICITPSYRARTFGSKSLQNGQFDVLVLYILFLADTILCKSGIHRRINSPSSHERTCRKSRSSKHCLKYKVCITHRVTLTVL
jgi:hypothetical protein